jgi:hypothetical protein
MAIGANNRSPLFARFQGGSLVINDINQIPNAVWFVNSATGVDSSNSYGRTPDAPYKTLAFAVTKVSADDVIVCLPTHSETLSGGNLSVTGAGNIGLKIVGLNQGDRRPQFLFGDASSALLLNAAGVRLSNFTFLATGFAAVTACVSVTAAGCVLDNCQFQLANAVNQAVLGVQTNSNRTCIQDCFFYGTTDAGTTTAISILAGDGHLIRHNRILGAYTTTVGGIRNVSVACTNCVIDGNIISNTTASSTKAITMLAGATGMIVNNQLAILSGSAPVTAAGMGLPGNVFTNSAGGGSIVL